MYVKLNGKEFLTIGTNKQHCKCLAVKLLPTNIFNKKLSSTTRTNSKSAMNLGVIVDSIFLKHITAVSSHQLRSPDVKGTALNASNRYEMPLSRTTVVLSVMKMRILWKSKAAIRKDPCTLLYEL